MTLLNQPKEPDVVIVGAGPVGLVLANLLGLQGVPTVLLERNGELEPEPRAVTLDDESLRTIQSAGLLDDVLRDVVQGYGVQYFGWNGRPFASIQPTQQEYGFAKRNAFRQPSLVRTLHAGLSRFPHVTVLFGHNVTEFEQHAQGIACHAARNDGTSARFSSSWLVACDGARSPVRERCGITLAGATYPQRWLIVDLAQRREPLRHTSTYCDPRRPAIRLPGPFGSLRYEFMLRPGDRDEEVLEEAHFRSWIRQRMPADADLPLVRKAIYGFHARIAQRWRAGRVLLAGDAAHLTPPFAGQGLNSGIRDAANLAWKLAAATQWGMDEDLLDTYESERRPHANALIQMALRIGTFMQPKSLAAAILGQTALRAACLVPAVRDYILQLRFKPKPRFGSGWFLPHPGTVGAGLVPQPLVEHPTRGVLRLDDMLGSGFSVIGWESPGFEATAASLAPAGVPLRLLALIPRDHDFLPSPWQGVERVRDHTGELGAYFSRLGAKAMVLRPDRYWYRVIPQDDVSPRQADMPLHAATPQ